MAKLKPAQIAEVKGKGFLINRGTENFSGRIVPRGTVFSPDDLKTVSKISSKFGNGKVIPTTRLGLEIQGIPYENVQDAIDYAEKLWKQFHDLPLRAVTDQPLFYLAILAVILGVQLFLAGFLGELINRNSSERNKYLIDKTL